MKKSLSIFGHNSLYSYPQITFQFLAELLYITRDDRHITQEAACDCVPGVMDCTYSLIVNLLK